MQRLGQLGQRPFVAHAAAVMEKARGEPRSWRRKLDTFVDGLDEGLVGVSTLEDAPRPGAYA